MYTGVTHPVTGLYVEIITSNTKPLNFIMAIFLLTTGELLL